MSEGLVRVGKRTCLHPNCWCAWCKVCGVKLTHCDFTSEDALSSALSEDHPCFRESEPSKG